MRVLLLQQIIVAETKLAVASSLSVRVRDRLEELQERRGRLDVLRERNGLLQQVNTVSINPKDRKQRTEAMV